MFKEKLLNARLSKNFTQEEMGEMLAITQASYCKLETGVKTPSLNTLIRICEVLEITPNFLLSDELKIQNNSESEEKIA